MYTVIFDSEIKGFLKVNGNCFFDICAKAVMAKLDRCFIVEFCPYESGYECFCEKINLACLQIQNCRVLFWNDCVVTIKLYPKRKREVRPLVAFSQVFCGDTTVTLCDDGSSFLLLECEEHMRVLPLPVCLLSGRLSMQILFGKEFVRLSGEWQNGSYLGLYEMQEPFQPLYEGVGESFAVEGEIVVKRKVCSSMAHPRVETRYDLRSFDREQEKIELIDYSHGYEKNLNSLLKIYAFLEGVSDGIEELCRQFLHTDLQADFTLSLAREYFLGFVEIVISPIYRRENTVALVYFEGESMLSARHFTFAFEGGKISNFFEV